MNTRVAAVLAVLSRVLSLVATLLVLLILALSGAAFLAVSGASVPLLRWATAQLGQLIAGQHTDALALNVRVLPAEGRLVGTASLTVHADVDGRQRFYFLLNPGLHVRALRVQGNTAATPGALHQLSLLTVVDVGGPVAKGTPIQLTFDYDGAPSGGMLNLTSNVINPQQVLLNVDGFWYPSDAQGFFTADVTVTVPSAMTVVHNGAPATRTQRGDAQQVRWTMPRPVGGIALIAGPYELKTATLDGIGYRLYLPPDIALDADRILTAMATANRTLTERYGPSGYEQVTAFVSRDLRRAFNDGSGVMGIALRYFRLGDYGFGILAHETAHNWWGGTVAERWLSPGSGGEWLVEGFAESSSLIATEAAFGPQALARRLADELFDPARQTAVADMSVLDNALTDATARDTIYRKGAYVAAMLRRVLGDDVYFRALREFLTRFRLQQATDRDLQQVLEEVSGQKLDAFFADWVRSNHLADLSLDGANQAEVTVNNLGNAALPNDIDLWIYKRGAAEPSRTTVHVGDRLPLEADADYAVVDPLLAWADVQRENNRYPRRQEPIYVAASSRSELAVTTGEPYPWVRAAVAHVGSNGRNVHTWDFDRGLMGPPRWSPDGTALVLASADDPAKLPAIVSLSGDGTRRTIGRGTDPAPAADGAVYAAQSDRVVRFMPNGSQSTVFRRRGTVIDAPLPSPDGMQVAYTAAQRHRLELHVIGRDGANDRFILSSDRDRFTYRWAPDGSRLYALAGGTWDWQIWEIPLDEQPVNVLVSGAAAIADFVLSPDGTQLAFTAAPEIAYPANRRRLYIMSLSDHAVRPIDIGGADLSDLTWAGNDAITVVATLTDAGHAGVLPAMRSLKRVRLADGSVEDLPR
jgi:hypothetical protein